MEVIGKARERSIHLAAWGKEAVKATRFSRVNRRVTGILDSAAETASQRPKAHDGQSLEIVESSLGGVEVKYKRPSYANDGATMSITMGCTYDDYGSLCYVSARMARDDHRGNVNEWQHVVGGPPSDNTLRFSEVMHELKRAEDFAATPEPISA